MTKLSQYVRGDRVIWFAVIMLSIFGMLAVYSSTSTLAYKLQGGDTEYYLFKHFTFILVGLFAMWIFHNLPYKLFSKNLFFPFFYLSIFFLILVLFWGNAINDARRWMTVFGIRFQVSDFAKITLIMYLARYLSVKQETIKSFKETFIPAMGFIVGICFLIAIHDLSTAIILFVTSFILLFVGRVHFFQLISVTLAMFLVAVLAVIVLRSTPDSTLADKGRLLTWKHRIEGYSNPEQQAIDNYQVRQAEIAIARGGILPNGPGNSKQKNFLPHPYSDYIYAIIIEEYGLLGGLTIIVLYLLILFRTIRMVIKAPKAYPVFLAFGLCLLLVFQAFTHMAVAVNLFPVTGLTLPMVSMGGSSMIFTSIAMGIILSVSQEIYRQEESTIPIDSIPEQNSL